MVDRRRHAGRLGGGDDGRHVLRLEGEGARRFEVDQRRILADQAGDAGADERVVEGGLHAEPLQQVVAQPAGGKVDRSEEHTSELPSLMRISYAVFCLKKKTKKN